MVPPQPRCRGTGALHTSPRGCVVSVGPRAAARLAEAGGRAPARGGGVAALASPPTPVGVSPLSRGRVGGVLGCPVTVGVGLGCAHAPNARG